jgi:hypothetical protein
LRPIDIRPVQTPTNNEEAIVSDIGDRAAPERMVQDVRAVAHLAGVIGSYTLEDLFCVKVRRQFDVFESTRLAGVERCILFASSNHAFGCYPITENLSPALPARRDSLCGVFKVSLVGAGRAQGSGQNCAMSQANCSASAPRGTGWRFPWPVPLAVPVAHDELSLRARAAACTVSKRCRGAAIYSLLNKLSKLSTTSSNVLASARRWHWSVRQDRRGRSARLRSRGHCLPRSPWPRFR